MSQAIVHAGAEAQAPRVLLHDRGIVAVGGADAEGFLQGLLTNDTAGIDTGAAGYAALLTPQGKILFDFLLVRDPGGFLLDCPRDMVADLVKRLTFYRLRAKVTIEDRSAVNSVVAEWGVGADGRAEGLGYRDPRLADLGWRQVVPTGALPPNTSTWEDYEAHRITLGVPRGGIDFHYGDAFPHEANLDRLHGLDFHKGCYVGQEVVSRVEHRGLARKRIVRVTFDGEAPPVSTEIFAGKTSLGHFGSSIPGHGLAMLRIDRVEQALSTGEAMVAGDTLLHINP